MRGFTCNLDLLGWLFFRSLLERYEWVNSHERVLILRGACCSADALGDRELFDFVEVDFNRLWSAV